MVELKVIVEVYLAEDRKGDGIGGQNAIEVSGGVEASTCWVCKAANSVAGTTQVDLDSDRRMRPSGFATGSAASTAGAQAAQAPDDQWVELDGRGLIEESIQQSVVVRRGQVERLPDCLLFRARVPPPEPFEFEDGAFAIGEWRPHGPYCSEGRASESGARRLGSDIAARLGRRRFEPGGFEAGRFEPGRFLPGRLQRGRLMCRLD